MVTRDPRKIIFEKAKERARRRRISFKFKRDEWLEWWETQLGPEWASLRGTGKDQYVMARNGDVGPYAAYNVRCVKAGVNVSESNQRRMKITKQMLRAGVLAYKELNGNCDDTELVRNIYIAVRQAKWVCYKRKRVRCLN